MKQTTTTTGSMEERRQAVRDIENQILEITGISSSDRCRIIETTGISSRDGWRNNPSICHEVRTLMGKRKGILNNMFRPNEANMEHFKIVNTRLESLCRQVCKRMESLKQSLPNIIATDFDDDYVLEGELSFCFNDEDSILRLDDDFYGSDFSLMVCIIDSLNSGTYWECIERFYPGQPSLDDGVSWNEYPFSGRAEFDGIVICHAMHNIACHTDYSVLDILRMNDFWAEVHLTFQSITEQSGKRYIITNPHK